MQRLLWASTGTKDPTRPTRSTCTASPRRSRSTRCPTRRSRPSTTTARSASRCRADGGDCDELLAQFTDAGVDVDALAAQAPVARARSRSSTSWKDLMAQASKSRAAAARVKASMATGHSRSTRLRAWKALEQHHAEIAGTPSARSVRRRTRARGERLTVEARRALPRLLEEPDHRRDAAPAARSSPRSAGCASASRRCSAASASTCPRTASVLHVALRDAEGRVARWSTASTSSRRCTRCSTAWPTFATACASGDVEGAHRQAASRTSSTSASAAPTSGPVMAYEALRHYSARDLTFRFVSNVDSTDFAEATRDLDPGRDAVHRLVQDVHARSRR